LSSIGQNSFRLLRKIKDPKFEIDRLEFYSLSLFIGIYDFQILITDEEVNQCVLLEDYVLDPKLKDSEKFSVTKFIFDDHHLLLANFWKSITLIIKNKVYSFIPRFHFADDQLFNYLNINTSYNLDEEEVMLTYHNQLDLVNVFSVSKSVVNLASDVYPGKKVKFIHQSSSLINGAIKLNSFEHQDILLYIDRFGLHIVVVDNKKLIFYNQYTIKKFGDYIKYIKIVTNELQIDLIQDQLILYGYLGANTPHFNELKKSMPNLVLGSRPENLNFGYVFDEILDHQYFDLFSTDKIRF